MILYNISLSVIGRRFLFVCLYLFTLNAHSLNVISFGDSITQGLKRTATGFLYGITSHQNGSVNIGGYQPYLNSKLDSNLEASTVYNWGHGGDRSTDGVSRINGVLNSQSADYILIMFGANDLFHGISSSSTKANISTMVSRSRAKNVEPIISQITHNTFVNGFNPAIRLDYNPKIQALANERNVPIALNYVAIDGPNWYAVPYHSGDQLHLSNAGNERLAQEWFDVLKSLNPKAIITPILELLLF